MLLAPRRGPHLSLKCYSRLHAVQVLKVRFSDPFDLSNSFRFWHILGSAASPEFVWNPLGPPRGAPQEAQRSSSTLHDARPFAARSLDAPPVVVFDPSASQMCTAPTRHASFLKNLHGAEATGTFTLPSRSFFVACGILMKHFQIEAFFVFVVVACCATHDDADASFTSQASFTKVF